MTSRLSSSSAFLAPLPRLTPVVVRGCLAAALVLLFGLFLARTAGMTRIDTAASIALNELHTGAIGAISSAAYVIFGPIPAVAITCAIAAVIWTMSRDFRQGLTFGAVVAITWVPIVVVKMAVNRPRPDPTTLPHPFGTVLADASYPSGHMAFIAALVMAFILLARGHRARMIVGILGGAFIAIFALALVIDGVHYPTDVIASIVWSIGLAPLVLELWNRFVAPRLAFTGRGIGQAA